MRSVCQDPGGSGACLDVPSGSPEAEQTTMHRVFVSPEAPAGHVHVASAAPGGSDERHADSDELPRA